MLGMLLGFESADAQNHLRRSVSLDPSSAEAQLWLGSARRVAGDFAGEIAAYRRAHALDPQWFRPVRDLSIALAEMGDRQAAEALVHKSYPANAMNRKTPLGRIAWIYGDVSEAMKFWTSLPQTESIWQAPVRVHLSVARFTLGLAAKPEPPLPLLELRSPQGRVWLPQAPSPAQWRHQNRNADAAMVYRFDNIVGAKHMIAAGRTGELVATWRSPSGLLGLHKDERVAPHHLHAAALVALVLRAAGEPAEAARLVAEASKLATALSAKGTVPFALQADVAAIEAAAGRREQALSALEGALGRGWVNNGTDDLPRLADEPAFAAIKAEPRFVAAVGRLDALYARERAEVFALKLPV